MIVQTITSQKEVMWSFLLIITYGYTRFYGIQIVSIIRSSHAVSGAVTTEEPDTVSSFVRKE